MRFTGAFKSYKKNLLENKENILFWLLLGVEDSIRHTIVFIVFLFPVVMKFYCDVYCVFFSTFRKT